MTQATTCRATTGALRGVPRPPILAVDAGNLVHIGKYIDGTPHSTPKISADGRGRRDRFVDASEPRVRGRNDTVTIGWPSDVPSWDPNQRFTPDAQPIFKVVFDQPLDQNPKLKLDAAPDQELGARGRRPEHGGRAARRRHVPQRRQDDARRISATPSSSASRPAIKLDTANSWRKVQDIEIAVADQGDDEVQLAGADRAAMAGLPRQLHRAEEIHGVGRASRASVKKPVGTGPYKLVEYRAQLPHRARAQRRLLGTEAEDRARHHPDHQGSVGARRGDSVRPGRLHHQRAGARGRSASSRRPGFAAELNPITRVILLQVRNDLGFADENVRLAAHHAIDKAGAVEGVLRRRRGAAVGARDPRHARLSRRLQVRVRPGARQAVCWPNRASARTSRSRSASPPTNGHFPSDYDIARAIVQMWKRVGIDAKLEIIEYAKYFELNRGSQAAGGDALQLGQRHRRPGNLRRLSAQSEDAVLGLEGHGGRRRRWSSCSTSPTTTKRIAGYRELNTRRGRDRRDHAAAAERADAGAQEGPDLREVRQRLGAARSTMDWRGADLALRPA